MKNKEKYHDEIFRIACLGYAVAMVNGKLCRCGDTPCSNCDLNPVESCTLEFQKWCESEYTEPKPKLTRQERAFIDYITEDFKIERFVDGSLFILFDCMHTKHNEYLELDTNLFKFIAANKSMTKKELLSLEVE